MCFLCSRLRQTKSSIVIQSNDAQLATGFTPADWQQQFSNDLFLLEMGKEPSFLVFGSVEIWFTCSLYWNLFGSVPDRFGSLMVFTLELFCLLGRWPTTTFVHDVCAVFYREVIKIYFQFESDSIRISIFFYLACIGRSFSGQTVLFQTLETL